MNLSRLDFRRPGERHDRPPAPTDLCGWSARRPVLPGLYRYRSPTAPERVMMAHVQRTPVGELVARFVNGVWEVEGLAGDWLGPLIRRVK